MGKRWHYVDKHGHEVIKVLGEVEAAREAKEEAKKARDRAEKARIKAEERLAEEENIRVNGRKFEFIMVDPTAPPQTRQKAKRSDSNKLKQIKSTRLPLSQLYPPKSSSSRLS